MSTARKRAFAAAAAAAAVAIGGSVAYAATRGVDGITTVRGGTGGGDVVTGKCKVARIAFATHADGNSTTSSQFVDVPGAVVPFKVGGTAPTCVMAGFTSMSFAQSNQVMRVRALLDGSVVGDPPNPQFIGQGPAGAAESHAMNFVFNGVAPGTHTLKIQFESDLGGLVFLHQGSTVVFYR